MELTCGSTATSAAWDGRWSAAATRGRRLGSQPSDEESTSRSSGIKCCATQTLRWPCANSVHRASETAGSLSLPLKYRNLMVVSPKLILECVDTPSGRIM
jgi:hypothetical protein